MSFDIFTKCAVCGEYIVKTNCWDEPVAVNGVHEVAYITETIYICDKCEEAGK